VLDRMSAKSILLGAGALGAVLGVGTLTATPQGRAAVATKAADEKRPFELTARPGT